MSAALKLGIYAAILCALFAASFLVARAVTQERVGEGDTGHAASAVGFEQGGSGS